MIDSNPETYKHYLFVSDLESKVFDLGNPYLDKWDNCIKWIYEEANCDGWQEVANKRPDIMKEAYYEALTFIAENKI